MFASFKPDMIAFVQTLAYGNKEKHKQTASIMHLLSLAIHMFGFLTHRACLASCCLAGIRESNWLVHVSKEKPCFHGLQRLLERDPNTTIVSTSCLAR
jgi:hypothetical protein